MARNFLRVDGDTIVDASGSPVVLRGVGLGGWMNMENFITGYPANESAMREAVSAVVGAESRRMRSSSGCSTGSSRPRTRSSWRRWA